jgi:hypothetical protein
MTILKTSAIAAAIVVSLAVPTLASAQDWGRQGGYRETAPSRSYYDPGQGARMSHLRSDLDQTRADYRWAAGAGRIDRREADSSFWRMRLIRQRMIHARHLSPWEARDMGDQVHSLHQQLRSRW